MLNFEKLNALMNLLGYDIKKINIDSLYEKILTHISENIINIEKDNQLMIISLNIANAHNDESTENRLGNRIKYLLTYLWIINEIVKIDILVLQELRKCSNENGDILEPDDIAILISKVLKLRIAIMQPNNETELSFNKLTLFNQKKLFHLNSYTVYPGEIYDLPNNDKPFMQHAQCMVFSDFYLRTPFTAKYDFNNIKFISVCNIHTPVSLDGKINYLNKLIKYYGENLEHFEKRNLQLLGDFNMFIEHIDEMKNLMEESKYFHHQSEQIEQTFENFDHDKGVNWISQGSNSEIVKITSILDHVYSNTNRTYFQNIKSFALNGIVTIDDNTEKRISDHFILFDQILIQ